MPLEIELTNRFKRDLKKNYLKTASREWCEVINFLVKGEKLPEKYKDHQLTGEFHGFRDCHVFPDLVLIYEVRDNVVQLVRLASHSEVFSK